MNPDVTDTEFVHFEVVAERPRRRRRAAPGVARARPRRGHVRRGHAVARRAHDRRPTSSRQPSSRPGARPCRLRRYRAADEPR